MFQPLPLDLQSLSMICFIFRMGNPPSLQSAEVGRLGTHLVAEKRRRQTGPLWVFRWVLVVLPGLPGVPARRTWCCSHQKLGCIKPKEFDCTEALPTNCRCSVRKNEDDKGKPFFFLRVGHHQPSTDLRCSSILHCQLCIFVDTWFCLNRWLCPPFIVWCFCGPGYVLCRWSDSIVRHVHAYIYIIRTTHTLCIYIYTYTHNINRM